MMNTRKTNGALFLASLLGCTMIAGCSVQNVVKVAEEFSPESTAPQVAEDDGRPDIDETQLDESAKVSEHGVIYYDANPQFVEDYPGATKVDFTNICSEIRWPHLNQFEFYHQHDHVNADAEARYCAFVNADNPQSRTLSVQSLPYILIGHTGVPVEGVNVHKDVPEIRVTRNEFDPDDGHSCAAEITTTEGSFLFQILDANAMHSREKNCQDAVDLLQLVYADIGAPPATVEYWDVYKTVREEMGQPVHQWG